MLFVPRTGGEPVGLGGGRVATLDVACDAPPRAAAEAWCAAHGVLPGRGQCNRNDVGHKDLVS